MGCEYVIHCVCEYMPDMSAWNVREKVYLLLERPESDWKVTPDPTVRISEQNLRPVTRQQSPEKYIRYMRHACGDRFRSTLGLREGNPTLIFISYNR
jgi:hypothetical protein